MPRRIWAKVALSPVSVANAKENMGENPGWDFDAVHRQAVAAWEKELANVRVDGTEDQKAIFYTGLYHAFSDCNGEFMYADYTTGKLPAGETHYSTFSLWDTFRACHPMYTLLKQDRVADFVKSMLRQYDTYGYLPIWQLWGTDNYCMIGNHAISPWRIYEKYGYYPEDLQTQSVSITLEESYNDACVARLAKALGKTGDYEFFERRSRNYRNLFDSSTGFFRAKNSDGRWVEPFNPLQYGGNGGNPYTEANAWQYRFYVPQDVPDLIRLIRLMGGNKKFVAELDKFFTLTGGEAEKNGNASGFIGQYAHGNEPSHHCAYLYNYAGQPRKTQYYVNKVMTEQYKNRIDGYSGNEDCGQMSSWYILSSMGFYPVDPANGVYEFGSPQFRDCYVKGVRLNGKAYKKDYILHRDIMNGGTLEFTMGTK